MPTKNELLAELEAEGVEPPAGATKAELEKLLEFDEVILAFDNDSAGQAAIEDCIYYLERALASASNPSVEVGEFVFNTRKLARDQFMKRYHLRKIAIVLANAENNASGGGK